MFGTALVSRTVLQCMRHPLMGVMWPCAAWAGLCGGGGGGEENIQQISVTVVGVGRGRTYAGRETEHPWHATHVAASSRQYPTVPLSSPHQISCVYLN